MSGIDPIWWLRAAEGLTLVIGAAIAYASLRAYARTRDSGLALLGVGFVIVTVAAALAGVLYEVSTHDLLTAWTVSATLELAGFALILYSIVHRPRVPADRADGDPSGGTPGGGGVRPRPRWSRTGSARAARDDLLAVRGPADGERSHLTERGEVLADRLLAGRFGDHVEVVLLVGHRVPVDLDPGLSRVLDDREQARGHLGVPGGASVGGVRVLGHEERHAGSGPARPLNRVETRGPHSSATDWPPAREGTRVVGPDGFEPSTDRL
jgi:hypothetical protein